ncbi:DASH complex subunit Dad3-domain-containing protein [Tuber brumale]|nr:DASH complex subunit Dad3-domain-containing protein [Tuber brumale]
MSTTPPHHSPSSGPSLLTPLEQEILDEYSRLLHNMNNLSTSIATIAGTPTAKILDSMRGLERKTGLVFTLLKASVYSMVLQQQLDVEGREGEGGGGDGGERYGKGEGGGGGEDETRLG